MPRWIVCGMIGPPLLPYQNAYYPKRTADAPNSWYVCSTFLAVNGSLFGPFFQALPRLGAAVACQ